jgi:hypothetical protein
VPHRSGHATGGTDAFDTFAPSNGRDGRCKECMSLYKLAMPTTGRVKSSS